MHLAASAPILAVAVVALLVIVAQLLLARVERVVSDEARAAAQAWAAYVARTVPDLDMILEGEPASVPAQDQLTSLRTMGDLVRFDFFDVDGRIVLASESLSTPADASEVDADALAVARGGVERTGMQRAAGRGAAHARSWAYVPVRIGTRVAGVVRLEADQTARVQRIERAFVLVATVVTVMLGVLLAAAAYVWRQLSRRKREAEERVHYLARHDVLTGATNRETFMHALHDAAERAARDGSCHAVLCIDLDHFKQINDSLGHGAGDELLRQVVDRLRMLVRSGDVVARLGGDEFAVLQTAVSGAGDVEALGRRIVARLAEPYDLPGRQVAAAGSVGAALHGRDATDPEALIHCADVAMYSAKTGGRRSFAFYDRALENKRNRHAELTRALREAIAGDALTLHFQPLFDGDGKTLRGFEALARWTHPTLGPVSPGEFVPLAEQAGLIFDLGRWALRQACKEAVDWPHGLTVAVNLSPAQFSTEHAIVEQVRDALAASGLPAGRLELEITESLLMSNTEVVLAALQQLQAMGVRIAMDDFGTGFSSLGYLWRFPFDKLKIDRSFVQGLGQDAKVDLVVKSIVSLAHALKMRVNAEGVETGSQLAQLRTLGCDELQGYLLGRPGPVEPVVDAVARTAERPLTARTDFAPLDPRVLPG
jgi:diguanylate cyclase (GGDEF)-like protein